MNILLTATIFEYLVLIVNLTFLIQEAIKNRNKKKNPFLIYKKSGAPPNAIEAENFSKTKSNAIFGVSLAAGKVKKSRKKKRRRIKKVGSKLNANPSTLVQPSSIQFAEDAANPNQDVPKKRVKKKRKRRKKAKTQNQE